MVPEASPLSIDLLSPNFSMTYMPCLIPITVHTEALSGRTIGPLSLRAKIWAGLWQCEHKLMTSAHSALSVTSTPMRARLKPGVRILNSTRTVCRWIRKLDLARYEPPPSSKNKEGCSFAIKLSLWYVSSSDDSQFLPAPSPAPLLTSCYLFLSIICFSALLDKE